MSDLAGTGTLLRFAVRRDRVRLVVWIAALATFSAFTSSSVQSLYADRADLVAYAATVRTNQAVVAMSGPARALDTYGGRTAFEIWQFSVAIGIMAVLLVGRHTRTEEESGRADLVQSAPVGRHARSLAAWSVGAGASALVGIGTAIGLVATGLPPAGVATLGAGFAATGAVFAALALLAAQVTERSRTTTGLAIAAVAVAYVLRAIGDAGSGVASWLSPLGWMQATPPYSGERWWPLAISLVATATIGGVAVGIERRRDVGVGLLHARPGPGRATAALSGPVGLAWRLQRSSALSWATGTALGGAAMGSVAHSADDLVGDNEGIREYLATMGDASLADIFLATILVYLAMVVGGFALQSALRARAEETAGRAEPILASATSRRRWSSGHLLVAFAGAPVVLVLAGAGTGLGHGLATGDMGEVPRLGIAALAYAPAIWLMIGVAAALLGLRPGASATSWAVLALTVVVAVLGQALDLPVIVRDLSPFTHVAAAPAEGMRWLPAGVLTALATLLTAAGLWGLNRRDLG